MLVGPQHGGAARIAQRGEQRRQQQQRRAPTLAAGRGVAQPPVRAGAGQMSSDAHAVSAEHAVLDRYQALLREYRLHKSALGAWFGAVQAATQRPPQLLDAQATGDEALVARFQQYLMVRKRLLAEIPLMRQQLDDALLQDDGTHQHHSSGSRARAGAVRGGSSKQGGAVNANHAAPISPSQAVGQFFAAVNYRQQHAASATATAAATAAGQQQQLAAGSGAAGTGGQQSARGEGAASHILTATASSSGGAAGGGSRAAAAAMAALAYKRSGGSGGASASSSSGGQRQQRPLAMQLAEAPKPPPGYEQQQQRLDAAGAGGAPGSTPSAPLVEAGCVAAVFAAAPRRAAALDADVSLEATLQGVPGGLGGGVLFASTRALTAAAADAAPAGSSEPGARHEQQQQSQAPVGEVLTARFPVVSGRQGRLAQGHLDEFLAGLSEASSQTPAAAAGAGAVAAAAGAAPAPVTRPAAAAPAATAAPPKQQQQQQQRVSSSSCGGSDGGGLPLGGLPPDILPVPT